MGLISMLSLDLLAQDKNIPEELKPYYEAYYKKRFAFVQGLFKNAGDPDFRKEAFSSNKKIKIRPKRSKKARSHCRGTLCLHLFLWTYMKLYSTPCHFLFPLLTGIVTR